MTPDEEAKTLLIGYDPKKGDEVKKCIELATMTEVTWAYHPYSQNCIYPIDLYVFELDSKKFVLVDGFKITYGSFDSIMTSCRAYVGGIIV